jgi:hypothetical protein
MPWYTGDWTGTKEADIKEFACQMCPAFLSPIYHTSFLDQKTREHIEEYKDYFRGKQEEENRRASTTTSSSTSTTTGIGYLPSNRDRTGKFIDNAQFYKIDLTKKSEHSSLWHIRPVKPAPALASIRE